MNRIFARVMVLLALSGLLIMPNVAMAAPEVPEGIEFRIAYANGEYEVYMRSNLDPSGPALTLTSQVTLKVPHGVGAEQFQIGDLVSAVSGTEWMATSRINAPVEDGDADYISLTVDFPTGERKAFDWAAGREIKVFSFKNEGSCLGVVELLSNDDAFVPDLAQRRYNSVMTNPGNQINVLNMGYDNLFAGIYGDAASCGDNRNLEERTYDLYLPIITSN